MTSCGNLDSGGNGVLQSPSFLNIVVSNLARFQFQLVNEFHQQLMGGLIGAVQPYHFLLISPVSFHFPHFQVGLGHVLIILFEMGTEHLTLRESNTMNTN